MSVTVVVTLTICTCLLLILRVKLDVALVGAFGDKACEPMPAPVGWRLIKLGWIYNIAQSLICKWRRFLCKRIISRKEQNDSKICSGITARNNDVARRLKVFQMIHIEVILGVVFFCPIFLLCGFTSRDTTAVLWIGCTVAALDAAVIIVITYLKACYNGSEENPFKRQIQDHKQNETSRTDKNPFARPAQEQKDIKNHDKNE
jgi:hypothetical protein